MSDLVTPEEIDETARRLAGKIVRTPLVPFHASDPGLLIKPESLQPTGAFKLRGAYAAISALPEEQRTRGVVAHSSGNHAHAVAYAARELGIAAVIVVPRTASSFKVEASLALGAEVVYVEPMLSARVETSARLAAAHGYGLIPPFDDPKVIAGQGTIGQEIVIDAPNVDAVLVPVGGGGLIAGIAVAVKSRRPEVKVIGVEPELAADARESLRVGRPIAWPAADTGRTAADALRVERVGDLPFAHMTEYVDDMISVTEDEILEAMRQLAHGTRLIAEPAGAVATAAYLFHREQLPAGSSYVAVLSGGNVDRALFNEVFAAERPYALAAVSTG